jgi:hypothetical protein
LDNLKNLTNTYLYQLSQTNIDSKTYAEIDAFLKDKLDSCSESERIPVPADRAKTILMSKLKDIPGVAVFSIPDESGFQISNLGMRANGAGPVTILIIDEEE